ncbi:MAG: hypothetical protein IPI04_18190 [Ignavibacteria bacterium]|nr:hypothetical protein [Ignavibacteria bacterium]
MTITTLLGTTLLGYLLDIDCRLYKILSGCRVCLISWHNNELAKMISIGKLNEHNSDNKFTGKFHSLCSKIFNFTCKKSFKIFGTNKPFSRFEIYFFFYGMASL